MSHECKFCRQPIRDDERLTDQFGVAIDYHGTCIDKMRPDERQREALEAIAAMKVTQATDFRQLLALCMATAKAALVGAGSLSNGKGA